MYDEKEKGSICFVFSLSVQTTTRQPVQLCTLLHYITGDFATEIYRFTCC